MSKNKKRKPKKVLMSPHPLINFEIQKYYQNKPNLIVFI